LGTEEWGRRGRVAEVVQMSWGSGGSVKRWNSGDRVGRVDRVSEVGKRR
jgi:hypothetical protein